MLLIMGLMSAALKTGMKNKYLKSIYRKYNTLSNSGNILDSISPKQCI
jgi:hypothetical protein